MLEVHLRDLACRVVLIVSPKQIIEALRDLHVPVIIASFNQHLKQLYLQR